MRGVPLAPLLILALFSGAAARASEDPWAALQSRQAVVARIDVQVINVFDTRKPNERHWVARAANFVHFTTKESVVRETLLFKEGDRVDAGVIHETERLLRNLPYIRDASIEPETALDGSVTAVVTVHDAWSLKGGLKFNATGGNSVWRVRLEEVNFLGWGKQLRLSHEKDLERTTDEIAYLDPLLFGSRWTMQAAYSRLSDGESELLKVERPFFELSAPWALGVSASRTQNNETLYENDQTIYVFPHKQERISLYWRWLMELENRTATRFGIEYDANLDRYGELQVRRPGVLPPPDLDTRRFRGLVLYYSLAQDRYATFENLVAMSRTEDYNLGWEAEARGGYFSTELGSDADAWYFSGNAQKGWRKGDDTLTLLFGEGHVRKENQGFQDAYGHGSLTVYNQSMPMQTLAANADVVWGGHLDPEDWVYLGGSDGLRGYPNHYRSGDRRWMFSFEDRVVTPWDLWGLVQVGFVGYLDAGAIRSYQTGSWTRTCADVGGGLRVGNLKSAFGRVILLTVAVPLVKEPGLDNYQIVVGNVIRF